jgi:hypothetical protein
MPVFVGLSVLLVLALAMAFAAGGWGIAFGMFAILVYLLLREAWKSHILDDDSATTHEDRVDHPQRQVRL